MDCDAPQALNDFDLTVRRMHDDFLEANAVVITRSFFGEGPLYMRLVEFNTDQNAA